MGCCSTAGLRCDVLQTTCYDVRSKFNIASVDNAALVWSATNINLVPRPALTKCSGTPEPYCATYRYASSSKGFGCAVTSNYNKTVLTTTTSQAAPFGQDPSSVSISSTSTSSTSTKPQPGSTSSLSRVTSSSTTQVNATLLSGGAIAGIVAGCIVALAAVTWLVLLCLKRRRQRPAQQPGHPPFHLEASQDQYIYPQYMKPDGGINSSSWHHSRHLSDLHSQQSELEVRPFSPETLHTLSPRMSPELSEGRHFELAELPVLNK